MKHDKAKRSGLIVFFFVIAFIVTTVAPVSGESWYSTEVEELTERGILKPGQFIADAEITRAEFASIIMRALPLEEEVSAYSFPDVEEEKHDVAAVQAVTAAQMMNGYPDGSFRPENSLTRAEIAKVLSLAYQIEPSGKELPFSDLSGSHWAANYIAGLVSEGMVTGVTPDLYKPDETLTWAQAAVLIHRANEATRETVPVPNETATEIVEVEALSSDGRFLEITFSEPVHTIDESQFSIYHAASQQKHGVESIELMEDGRKALVTMYHGAGLLAVADYTIQYTVAGETSTYHYYRNEYLRIPKAKITEVDVTDREISISYGNGQKITLEVPAEIEIDFVDAFNREADIWHNSLGELTLYKLTNEAKDVKKNSKFINQFKLDEFIYIEGLEGTTVRGLHDEIDLADYDVIVKGHKTISAEEVKQGDLLLFNSSDKVVEVCTNLLTGRIDAVFADGVDIDDDFYEYDGYYWAQRDERLYDFDLKIAEELEGRRVTVFLNKDDDVVFVKR
ncbi:S-layer homology domain-containing protein [Alkalihalobacillus oceani]|uniref:S-layer homology domain-containing protein n=1 Tax=Halalkalibacter oceani TaxID=1653776 RepID=UPI00203F83AE|nr:S-layer homology domain-containing protein [Halalkalibacter oceani]